MKTILLMSTIWLLSGCTGTMLDGRVCTFYTDDALARQGLSDHIVTTYVDETDRAKAQLYLKTARLSATALCEMARAREAARGVVASQ